MKLRTQILSWLTKRPMRTTPEDWQHLRFSFSQFGEDLVLLNYLKEPHGFYVDVGAHHPVQFSNTYLLHRRGWHGVNIDATEEAIARFPASGEINRTVNDAQAVIDRVLAHYKPRALGIDYTDGVSISFADWRFNLRMSNTEPVIRLNVESRGDIALMQRKTAEILALMA